MLDKENPVKSATSSLIISFILFVIIILLLNPLCVQVIDKNTSENFTSYKLVLSYSLTFAIVVSIATLLILSSNKNYSDIEYNINEPFLHPNLAKEYKY